MTHRKSNIDQYETRQNESVWCSCSTSGIRRDAQVTNRGKTANSHNSETNKETRLQYMEYIDRHISTVNSFICEWSKKKKKKLNQPSA